MGSLGPAEILVIFLAVLLLFGAKRLPEIARGLGTAQREFKKALRDVQTEMNTSETTRPAPYRYTSKQIQAPDPIPASTPAVAASPAAEAASASGTDQPQAAAEEGDDSKEKEGQN